jgi:hypothetical protein
MLCSLVCKESAVVKYILKRFPELARVPDASGRLPLEVALERGKSWYMGVRELVLASPTCLAKADSQTRLYPFLLAASERKNKEQKYDLEEAHTRKRRKLSDGSHDDCPPLEVQGKEQLETIYLLLRESPNLIQFAI